MTYESGKGEVTSYSKFVESHLNKVISRGLAVHGPDPCPMWMSSLDIATGQYPKDDRRPAHIGKRVYRNIDAPKGSSLYWDQPALVAAHVLSGLTGSAPYADAADAYVQAFLHRCVAKNGVFLWGNHYYFDVYQGKTVWFKSEEEPKIVDFSTEDGWLHETRPIPPAWELFWRVDAEATERCIRRLAEMHVFDQATGGFNRHADKRRDHAFLEAGGILVETLAWLSGRISDEALEELALRVAAFSFRHKGPSGLLENNPTTDRWDKFVCTTEVGLWAGSLLRAADYTGMSDFQDMAEKAVLAYLEHGFDKQASRFYGQLRVADGTPVSDISPYPYQPRVHTSLWEPLFPTHDYPMAFAETCLSLLKRTNNHVFEEAVLRWVAIVREDTPANGGKGGYAEHYGRCIHFLLGAAWLLDRNDLEAQARDLADEAVAVLFSNEMFRGHPGEDRYDAVDGVGFLLLALLALDSGQPLDLMGFGF